MVNIETRGHTLFIIITFPFKEGTKCNRQYIVSLRNFIVVLLPVFQVKKKKKTKFKRE